MRKILEFFIGVLFANLGGRGEKLPDLSFTVYNNSADSIFVYIATGYRSPTAYPDTILPDLKVLESKQYSKYGQAVCDECEPNSLCRLHWHEEGEDFLDACSDTISCYIIRKDALNKYGYEHVKKHNTYICYDLSKDEVIGLHYAFYYPPREFMKDMKMYPPYSEIMKKE